MGNDHKHTSEYHRHAIDLMNFAQTVARYYEVRENNYAFASACREPEYLRVQLEKGRDWATLRDANQLLQSEGFYASFFFSFTARGEGIPTLETIRKRHEAMLTAMAEMFASVDPRPDTPYLLKFIETYARLYPAEAKIVVDALLDLSHGVFVDAEAAALWREVYLAGLRLDLQNIPFKKIDQARDRWRSAVLEDPSILYSRLGPQIACEVPSRQVHLVAFGLSGSLYFDINTVQEGIMRMVPDIRETDVDRWLTERSEQPFVSVVDFKNRVPLPKACLSALRFAVD